MPPLPPLRHDLIDHFLGRLPHRLLFVTMSGAHLYGFASADSDYDLRGAHIAAVRDIVRLSPPDETVEVMDKGSPVEMDIVTHDVRKFFSLLLRNNGYVLEQIYSPIVVRTGGGREFEELRALARGCITRNHHHHYRRFSQNQWEMVVKDRKPTVKGLLYTYRVLLAGIHLMRTGIVEANLVRLNESFRLSYIDELISAKTAGAEKQELRGKDLTAHEAEFVRLCAELERARESSSLPDEVSQGTRAGLDDLLVRLRMATV